MTQEEKAKAYDEALERATQVRLTKTKENMAAAEYIFPELRESEDERIRRNLVEAFIEYKKSGGTDFYGIEIDYLLAWLEKQKEIIENGYGLYYYHNGGFTFVGRPAEVVETKEPDEASKIAAAYQLGRSDERKQKE